jgi:hypothetical protein
VSGDGGDVSALAGSGYGARSAAGDITTAGQRAARRERRPHAHLRFPKGVRVLSRVLLRVVLRVLSDTAGIPLDSGGAL